VGNPWFEAVFGNISVDIFGFCKKVKAKATAKAKYRDPSTRRCAPSLRMTTKRELLQCIGMHRKKQRQPQMPTAGKADPLGNDKQERQVQMEVQVQVRVSSYCD
jgi:hypothetical protein